MLLIDVLLPRLGRDDLRWLWAIEFYPMTHAPWRNKRRTDDRVGDHCLTVVSTNEGVPSAGPVRPISPEAVWDAPRAIMHCLKKSGLTSAGELALSRVICSQIALASTDCRGGSVAQLARTLAVITSNASRTFPIRVPPSYGGPVKNPSQGIVR